MADPYSLRMDERICVVTGGSRGIGAEIVAAFVAMGVADEITAAFWKEIPSFHGVIHSLTAEDITIVPLFTAQGYFTSRSIFRPRSDHSVVDYQLSLEARLPKPFGLMLMPDRVIEQIASNITDWRIHEIAGGFIKRSVQEYREQTALSGIVQTVRSARPEWCPAVVAPQPRRIR